MQITIDWAMCHTISPSSQPASFPAAQAPSHLPTRLPILRLLGLAGLATARSTVHAYPAAIPPIFLEESAFARDLVFLLLLPAFLLYAPVK